MPALYPAGGGAGGRKVYHYRRAVCAGRFCCAVGKLLTSWECRSDADVCEAPVRGTKPIRAAKPLAGRGRRWLACRRENVARGCLGTSRRRETKPMGAGWRNAAAIGEDWTCIFGVLAGARRARERSQFPWGGPRAAVSNRGIGTDPAGVGRPRGVPARNEAMSGGLGPTPGRRAMQGYSADAAGGVSDCVSAVVVAGAGLASLPLAKLGTTDVAARAARLSSAGSGGVLDLWPK